jgi:hypothetical protein
VRNRILRALETMRAGTLVSFAQIVAILALVNFPAAISPAVRVRL